MTSLFFNTIFALLAKLPLRWVHALGAALGQLTYFVSSRYAQQLRSNLQQSGLGQADFPTLLKQSIREAGKASIEIPWVWKHSLDDISAAVQRCEGWEHLLAAQAQGKGMILLTPHWGCFEVAGLYVGQRIAMTSLYRTPKQPWLDAMTRAGRERGLLKMAPADLGGVRALYKTLKRGDALFILPDQVPGSGEGEWAPFFGKPAYTMTLVARLAQNSGAPLLTACAERLPHGQGYVLRIAPITLQPDASIPAQINRAMEQVITRAPAQYLWSYNRYKTPRGAPPPPNSNPD